MKKTAILILFATSLFGCKKRLKNDAEILVGEWEWAYTVEYSGSMGQLIYYYETPATNNGTTYSVEFEKKGIATLYQDGEEIRRSRIKYSHFEDENRTSGNYWYEFDLYLHGDGERQELSGWFLEFEEDTIYLREWPIESGLNTVEANVLVRK